MGIIILPPIILINFKISLYVLGFNINWMGVWKASILTTSIKEFPNVRKNKKKGEKKDQINEL